MKQSLSIFALALGLAVIAPVIPANATAVRTVTVAQASGSANGTLTEVPVARGFGVNIDFSATRERIYKVWLDDPSRIVFDTDSPLCSSADCTGAGATIIHLKQVNTINFQGLPRTGSTLMTVVTQTTAGETRSYQFRVVPISTSSQVSTIRIVPAPTPVARTPLRNAPLGLGSTRVTAAVSPEQSAIDIISRGLRTARQQNILTPDQPLWTQFQQCLQLLNSGYPLDSALRQSGVSVNALARLRQIADAPQTPAVPATPLSMRVQFSTTT